MQTFLHRFKHFKDEPQLCNPKPIVLQNIHQDLNKERLAQFQCSPYTPSLCTLTEFAH